MDSETAGSTRLISVSIVESQKSAMESNLPESRKEVFRVLVQAQDQGESVKQSRIKVARQFDLSMEEILEIEREGIRMTWPPL